jgi:anti-sigma-K factor RskA
VRNGRPVAAGFLDGRMAALTQPVPRGASVAVSLEPAGGSQRPTGPLLFRAETA